MNISEYREVSGKIFTDGGIVFVNLQWKIFIKRTFIDICIIYYSSLNIVVSLSIGPFLHKNFPPD